jgi:hypothetical protein
MSYLVFGDLENNESLNFKKNNLQEQWTNNSNKHKNIEKANKKEVIWCLKIEI